MSEIIVQADPDLEDLIPEFLDNRRADIGSMRAALANADFETVRGLGHSMKGSGGGFGFDAISAIGAALEQAAKRLDQAAIVQGVDQLADYLTRVKVVYEEL